MTLPRPLDGRAMLGSIGIFEGLSKREVDALHAVTSTKRLRAHEVLFRKGDPGSALYAVLRGRLRVFSTSADAKEVVFRFLEPGDVLGEVALFDAQVRSATVESVEPSELLTLQRRDLLPFLDSHPRVAIKLAAILARSLRELSQRVEEELSLTIPMRLARKLLALDPLARPTRARRRHAHRPAPAAARAGRARRRDAREREQADAPVGRRRARSGSRAAS